MADGEASAVVTPPDHGLSSQKSPQFLPDYDDDANEAAIDDSIDADEEIVDVQRSITQSRLQRRKSAGRLLQKVIPFHWAPMLSPLTESDTETCIILEELAFPEPEKRAPRELLRYRIKRCGSICFGLFNTYRPSDAEGWWIGTMRQCRPVETGRMDLSKRVMFAHIIATLGEGPFVTEDDMACPENWQNPNMSNSSHLGHKYFGRTLCLHSFAVCPEVQGIGIGKTAMKAYLQLMNESGVADRVALVCKDSLIDFFKRCGFEHAGHSKSTRLGGDLHDMFFELPGPKQLSRDKKDLLSA